MDTSEGLVTAAQAMALGTVPVMPASLSCFFLMDGGKGKDSELREAGNKWGEAGNKYSEAKEHLEGLVRGVSAHSWTGKDREAFENEIKQIAQQLETDHTYAKTAQTMLELMAVALDIFAAFAMAAGVALVTQAVICAAADCTVVGAPAAEAEANTFALICAEDLETANTVLAGAMGGAGALFQIGAIADAAQQNNEGDHSAMANLKQAEIKGGIEGAKAIANHVVGRYAGKKGHTLGEKAGEDAATKAEKETLEKASETGGEWGGETLSKTVLNSILPEGEGEKNKGSEESGNQENVGSYA
jgi:uncharacterized protein YukE